ncbi:MAG: hypothetical protein ACXWWQ_00485 [Candidatus Limnocylindria bacterium]
MFSEVRRRSRHAAVLSLTSLTLVLALAGPVAAVAGGNRGTVKIHETGSDQDDRRNEPQVCDFSLHFFGGNPNEAGTFRIEAWPPTGDGEPASTGAYMTDDDGNAIATPPRLPDGQYKLFWETGEGHAKHKVFKVDCPDDPGGGGGAG